MFRLIVATLLLISVLVPPPLLAQSPQTQQETKDTSNSLEKIKDEGMNRSQVMKTLSYLTDVIGPRLTGTPAMKRANEWTAEQFKRWGIDARLEPWGPFGQGWTLKRFAAQVIEPQAIPLIAYPKAWSASTKGVVTANLVYLNAKTEADLEQYRGKLKGEIVLISPPREVKAHFESKASRLTEKDLLNLADAPDPRLSPRRNRFQMTDEMRAAAKLAAQKFNFAFEQGAAVIVDGSRAGDGGTIFVQGATVAQPPSDQPFDPNRLQPWDKRAVDKIPPQMSISIEQYNRLVRMLEQGERIRMTVEIAAELNDAEKCFNTIAEIPGTDLKDEIVMLGAHLDSWHSGTGATDNAAGVAVVMEAARIIKTLDLKPRRTIRIGLWSGEEQGLLGSRAYVAEHLGVLGDGKTATVFSAMALGKMPPLQKKAEYDRFSAYYNLDNGTGRIRGVFLQGNEAVRPLFRQWLMPFKEMQATTLSISNTGGTDHQSFDMIGLPGFQFIQDQIEYETRTHHSNQDVYDRIQEADLKQAAIIMATFAYNTAMMNEKLPRKEMRQ